MIWRSRVTINELLHHFLPVMSDSIRGLVPLKEIIAQNFCEINPNLYYKLLLDVRKSDTCHDQIDPWEVDMSHFTFTWQSIKV